MAGWGLISIVLDVAGPLLIRGDIYPKWNEILMDGWMTLSKIQHYYSKNIEVMSSRLL